MDIARFRRRVLEIEAELAALDPRMPGTTERAGELREEIAALADEQRQHSTALGARAFGELVTPTGHDAPVEKVDQFIESVAGEYPTAQPPANEDPR
ncbi:MAG TPA: hypothetical protein VK086_07185 [Ruania sp.]|nr:hypothetical protein [Ruania sp.]